MGQGLYIVINWLGHKRSFAVGCGASSVSTTYGLGSRVQDLGLTV